MLLSMVAHPAKDGLARYMKGSGDAVHGKAECVKQHSNAFGCVVVSVLRAAGVLTPTPLTQIPLNPLGKTVLTLMF